MLLVSRHRKYIIWKKIQGSRDLHDGVPEVRVDSETVSEENDTRVRSPREDIRNNFIK